MDRVVIDTNVLLVANGAHREASPECVVACVDHLKSMQTTGVVVIDDAYRILGEYQHRTSLNPPKGVGDVFLKWLLRNAGNARFVEQVKITEAEDDVYAEFPDPELQSRFDPADRKFPAVANAHSSKPSIWQAVDCKWLDWWPRLAEHGIYVEFLCPGDVCRFYQHKFPDAGLPPLPSPRS